jgi:aminopeptidase-like protein
VLNLSDGDHSLLDIAERAGLEFALVHDVATELAGAGLLRAVTGEEGSRG